MPSVARGFVLTGLLIAASAVIGLASECAPRVMRAPLSALPMTFSPWNGRPDAEPDQATLDILGADDHLTRSYFGPSTPIGLYVGFWNSQQAGDTIHSPLNCLPGSGWEAGVTIAQGPVTMSLGDEQQYYSSINVYLPHGRTLRRPRIDDLITIMSNPEQELEGRLFRVTDVPVGGRIFSSVQIQAIGIAPSKQWSE